MDSSCRICTHCRVLVEPCGSGWRHVPQFAQKFDRSVCDTATPGRAPSESEQRFGLGRARNNRERHQLHDSFSALALPPSTPVTVGVDGSYKLHTGERVVKPMSWGYLSTGGVYGLGTSLVPGKLIGAVVDADGDDEARTLQAELRACSAALRHIDPATPVRILTDSRNAMNFLLLWRDGYDIMPSGYQTARSGGRLATLQRLAARMAQGGVDVEWVRGHAGHPLNEGANALAKLARAWTTGRIDKSTAAADARRQVLASLTRHAEHGQEMSSYSDTLLS